MKRIFVPIFLIFSQLVEGAPEPAAIVSPSPATPTATGVPSKSEGTVKKESSLDLVIMQDGFSQSDYFQDKEISFQSVCKEFAKLFVANRGLWGTGPFRKATCVADLKAAQAIPSSWRLVISGTSTQKKFDIMFLDSTGVAQQQSNFTVDTELSPTILLAVKRSRAIIAANLSMGLPFRSIVLKSAIRHEGEIKLPGLKINDLPAPEAPLQIFALGRSRGIWQPKVFATAEVAAENPGSLTFKINVFDSNTLLVTRGKSKSGVFYLQQSENRDEDRTRLSAALNQDLGGFLKKFLSIAKAVYLGGRYGQPLGRSTGVLSKAPTVGLFGEFRAGLLQGLKFNYDFIPEQKASISGSEQKFSWSRVQLGYGFGRRFDNFLFNWIDLTPKLGVTSLEYVQGASDDTGDPGYSFKLQRAPTLGAEIGIEKRTPYFLARLWSFGSYSVGMLQVDKKIKSSSVRVGLDVYRDMFAMGPIKVALLGFGAADNTTFTKSVSDAELEADPNVATELKYQSFYAGGGLTLTW